ncbi:MAG TPA: DUF3180 domain-containing protein [Aeromicrobium sp.]|mgnify:FL=1|nr:DUF3180 domain-containing protein [Aeromicrobium sp.]
MLPARRSSPLYLVLVLGVGLIVGRLLPEMIARVDGVSPPVPGWTAAVFLACGAFAVGVLAWVTWRNLHKHKRQYSAEHAIRLLALAKSAVLVGGVFAGGYAGYALAFVGATSDLGQLRLWRSIAAAVAAVLLLLAALALEWSCRLPTDGGEEETSEALPA